MNASLQPGEYCFLASTGAMGAYGAGAAEVVREIVEHQTPRAKLTNDLLRLGDIERAITEWRSLLRQIVQSPDFDMERWKLLKKASEQCIKGVHSSASVPSPELLPAQLRRHPPFRG